MEFKDQIIQRLKGLNNKQVCQFAWLCGLRILPFLSVIRDFAYWPMGNRQRYLYSIFNALDTSTLAVLTYNFTVDAAKAADVAATAVDAIYKIDTANATYATTKAINYAIDAAVQAINAAAKAITKTSAVATYIAIKTSATAAYIAVKAAAFAACTADTVTTASTTYDHTFMWWESLLLNDIETIKKNKLDECSHDIGIYGELWDRFQEDLNTIGCTYWAQFYKNLFNNGFNIDKEQLKRHFGVPDEIKAEGAAAVGRYLEGLGDQIEQLNETRIIILGEKGAGKTSLARRLLDVDAPMPKKYESTEGVETSLWRFPGKDGADVNAHIWDFAGHSITHAVHRCFMSARCLYIYVYNGRIEHDNDPAYWLEQIRIHGGDSPVLFLINEVDDHRADIAEKTLKNEYPSIVGYCRVNIGSEDKTKLEEFRQIVKDTVSSNPSWNNQIVSLEAYKIKNELREHFNETKVAHITRDKFDEIAKNCGVSTGRIEDILNDLNTLGICFWYNKPEIKDFNMLVLNPDWITNGIYKIINQSYNEHEHKLTASRGTEILRNDKRYEYPLDKVAFLFKLMRLYDLAFFENTDNIFIPGILPIDRPDEVPVFDDPNDRLTMSFVVEKALPPSITARIIVQRSEEIFDEKLLWRKGAVLKYKGSDTFARIIEESRSITVSVKGTEKTEYIASLRETIKAIFEDYKVIKPDLFYEVFLPEKSEKSESPLLVEKEKPLMLSEDMIRGYLQVMRPYFDAASMKEIFLDVTGQRYKLSIKTKDTEEMKAPIKTKGNHSPIVINSPGAIVDSVVNQSLPATVTEEQYKHILQMLKEFLKSEQAKKLTVEDFEKLKKEVTEMHNLEPKKGCERLLGFLSGAANITTIAGFISTFLAAHPEIPKGVISIFKSLILGITGP